MTIPRKIRAYVGIPVSPIDMGTAVFYAMTVMNLSLTGCFIKMNQALEVGTPLSFSLPLPEGKMLELRARITREHDEPHGYGVRFDSLSDDVRMELALLIAHSEEI